MNHRTLRVASLATLCAAILASAASAQGVVYEWPVTWGNVSLSTAGDVDGDGVADFAVGDPGQSSVAQGRLRLHSGADGSTLFIVSGAAIGDRFGDAVAPVGDVNGDGHDDVAVSATYTANLTGTVRPYVRVISGADGSKLWDLEAPHPRSFFGVALERFEDRDGDGVSELLVASQTAEPSGPSAQPSSVYVVSGASGAVLFEAQRPVGATPGFASNLTSAGDVDLDGVDDFAVADIAFGADLGRVSLHSGLDGSAIRVLDPPALQGSPAVFRWFGESLDSVGDVDGEGFRTWSSERRSRRSSPPSPWGVPESSLARTGRPSSPTPPSPRR